MLRKSGGPADALLASPSSTGRNDDEKGGKMKRQSQARMKSTLVFLATFCLIGAGALYAFQDSTDFDPFGPGGLRSRGLKRFQRKTSNEKEPSLLLPPDSIYHLSVDDCDGEPVSLDQYSGSVSLIVNVASS